MAINWGTIGNIEPPKVLGSIPASGGGGQSPLDSLAGGIMQGVGMADQMKTNAMAREQTQMQMDQSKQLFPAQLSAAQDQARVSKAAAAKAEREDEGIKAYRATIQQGYDKAMQAMQQVDPVGAIKMQQDLEDLRNKQGMAVESLAKGTKAQAEALDTIQAKAGQIASETVAMATDQQSGQIDWNKANAIYKQRLAPFTKSNPELTNSIFPAEFNQQSFLNMTYLGQQALANQQAALLSKEKPTSDSQNADEIARLQQMKEDGNITPVQEKKLASLQQLTAKQRMYPSTDEAITTKMVDLDVGTVKDATEASKDSDAVIAQAETFKKLNQRYKTGMFAESGLAINKAYEALTGQKLASTQLGEAITSAGMDQVLKRIAGTKGAISDREMEAFTQASAGMRNSKEGNDLIMDMVIGTEKRKKELAKAQRDYLRKNKSLDGFDEQWQKYIQANPIIDSKRLEPYLPKQGQQPGQPQQQGGGKVLTYNPQTGRLE